MMSDRFIKRIKTLADAQANLESKEIAPMTPYRYAVRDACFVDPNLGVLHQKRPPAVQRSTTNSLAHLHQALMTLDWLFNWRAEHSDKASAAQWMRRSLFDMRRGRLAVVQDDGNVACRWPDTGAVRVTSGAENCILPGAVRGVAFQRNSLETLCAMRDGSWRLIDQAFHSSRTLDHMFWSQSAVSISSANAHTSVFWLASNDRGLWAVDTRMPTADRRQTVHCRTPFVDGQVQCAENDTFLSVHSSAKRRVCVYDVRCMREDTFTFQKEQCDAAQWLPSSANAGVSTLACCTRSNAAADTTIGFFDGSGQSRASLALPSLDSARGRVLQVEFSKDNKHALALVQSEFDNSTRLYISAVDSGVGAHLSSTWARFSGADVPDLEAVHLCVDHDAPHCAANDGRTLAVLGSKQEWISHFTFGQPQTRSEKKMSFHRGTLAHQSAFLSHTQLR
jgi:hypothetical protein